MSSLPSPTDFRRLDALLVALLGAENDVERARARPDPEAARQTAAALLFCARGTEARRLLGSERERPDYDSPLAVAVLGLATSAAVDLFERAAAVRAWALETLGGASSA